MNLAHSLSRTTNSHDPIYIADQPHLPPYDHLYMFFAVVSIHALLKVSIVYCVVSLHAPRFFAVVSAIDFRFVQIPIRCSTKCPNEVLPIIIDVGTNNEALLKDHLYLGLQQHRLDGEEYIVVIDEFMEAVFTRWPHVIVQRFSNRRFPLLNSEIPLLNGFSNGICYETVPLQ
ncbi:hypothetical protein LXL04_001085 [Taraxacum kok-saghyz]